MIHHSPIQFPSSLTHEQLQSDIDRVGQLVTEAEASGNREMPSRSFVLSALKVQPSEVARELFDALDMETDSSDLRPNESLLNEPVNLRALLATLHLANSDGTAAFRVSTLARLSGWIDAEKYWKTNPYTHIHDKSLLVTDTICSA